MGMLDTLKRWFGGGDKPAPARPAPQMRAPAPNPVVVPTQTPAPASAPVVQPAPLTAAEALEVIAKASAKTAPPAPPPVAVERRERPRINAKDGTRVLVIDDSPTIVALLKRMLEQSGYIALEAIDAETGVALALSVVPDLIFLDIVLPGMNGFEALRRLRRDPISKTIPIIMISGNELATEQFYAQRIGADDFMKKPFSRSEVFARIEKLLDADKVIRRRVAPVATIHAVASNPAGAPATAAPPAVVPAAAAPAAVEVPVAAPAAAAVAPAPVPLAAVASTVPPTTPAPVPPQQAASN